MNSVSTITFFVISLICLYAFVNADSSCPTSPTPCTPAPSTNPTSGITGNLADINVFVKLCIQVIVNAGKNAMDTCQKMTKGGAQNLATIQANVMAEINAIISATSTLGNLLGSNGGSLLNI